MNFEGPRSTPPGRAFAATSYLFLAGDLFAQAFLLFLQFRRKFGAEIAGFEYLANFNLAVGRHGIGAPLDPLDGFFLRPHLPEPEASDQLFGLGEGTVDHCALCAGEADACALRTWL